MEIEHFITDRDTECSLPYSGTPGVREILRELAAHYPDAVPVQGEDYFGFSVPDFTITLEPAAQLEISIRSTLELAEIQRIYRDFRFVLDEILEKRNAKAMTVGCQPVSNVRTLPLIPKERYRLMDAYFEKVGDGGIEMMRGTASVQVSIDYADETDFRRKIQAISYYMPLLKLLSDHAEVFEGEPLTGHLKRTDIWNRTDRARCGVLPGVFSRTYGFRDYAAFLCRMPLIFRQDGDRAVSTGTLTSAEVYAGTKPTEEDVQHVLSMAFPDVRLKQYLEIRAADAMPARFMLSYTALIKGLFYQEAFLRETEERIQREDIREDSVRSAEAALMLDGYTALVYGRRAEEIAQEMLRSARLALPEHERHYLNALSEAVDAGGIWAAEKAVSEGR